MKETISKLSAFNPLEDMQTMRPPLPTELTVVPQASEPHNSHAEGAFKNAEESDESTGLVRKHTFKTKIARVKPGCYIDSDHPGSSKPVSNRSTKYNALKPITNPLSTKVIETLNSNIKESNSSKICCEALFSDKTIIVGKKVKVPF